MGGSRESVCTHKPPAESHSSPRGEEERGSLSCFPTLPCQLRLLAARLLRAAHAASRAAAGAGTGRSSPPDPSLLHPCAPVPCIPALLQSYGPALLYPCAPESTWCCIPTFLHPCILTALHPRTPTLLYPLQPCIPVPLHPCIRTPPNPYISVPLHPCLLSPL